MSKPDKRDAKNIDAKKVISYLNHTFAKTAEEVFGRIRPANTRGTPLYGFQVDHCYFVDEIQRGPTYMLPKVISDANANIAAMKEHGENNG